MKLKYAGNAAAASILLVLFLPVFYKVISTGNAVNYYDGYKIVTFYSNKVLFLYVLGGAAILFVLYGLLRKIPFNRYTAAGMVVGTFLICILFYAVNVKISKCIAFYGGWDCGAVANSAHWVYEGETMGYDDYYTIYANNVPITWLLYRLYWVSSELSGYPYNSEFIWIQFQCLMLTAALFFSVMTVLTVSKRIAASALTALVNIAFLGLSPWKVIPYTDVTTIAVPVFLMFLYALFLRVKSKKKYILWFLMVIAGILGGIMKATCYVPLIAIVGIDLIGVLSEKLSLSQKIKKLTFRAVLLLGGFLIAALCKEGMYRDLGYEYNYDMAITWENYLYIGLNDETTGGSTDEGLKIIQAYAESPRAVKNQVLRQCIKERIAERGVRGQLSFWGRKQVMNFNDGSFSWYKEGFFHSRDYENIIVSDWKQPLRDFYWEGGKNFILFNTISQGSWFFVLLGVIVEAGAVLGEACIHLRKKAAVDEQNTAVSISGVSIVTFIGIFLFVMLFEGRARYLLNSVAVFSTMAVCGYCKCADKVLSGFALSVDADGEESAEKFWL